MDGYVRVAFQLMDRMGKLREEAGNELEAIQESIEDHLEQLVTDDRDVFHVKQLARLWVARGAAAKRYYRRCELADAASVEYQLIVHKVSLGML
jgi:hypothetical protein